MKKNDPIQAPEPREKKTVRHAQKTNAKKPTPPLVSELRRNPYKVFCIEAVVFVWLGLLPWLLHPLGVVENYRPIFHAMTQIQGFVMCFVAAFLFTMLPRRTESPFPSITTLIIAAACPSFTVGLAWFGRWALAQCFWIVFCLTLLAFALPRIYGPLGRRKGPVCFVWLPLGFGFGLVGAVLAGLGASLGHTYWWVHQLGQKMVLQGTVLCIVLGAGGLIVPLVTRGEKPPDDDGLSHSKRATYLHLFSGLGLLLSFFVELRAHFQAGLFLRGMVFASVLIWGVRAGRRPNQPGLHRKSIWLSLWLIPLGYLLAASLEQHKVGLHLVFIGGFSLMAFSVGQHVIFAHGSQAEKKPNNWTSLCRLFWTSPVCLFPSRTDGLRPRSFLPVDGCRRCLLPGLECRLADGDSSCPSTWAQ